MMHGITTPNQFLDASLQTLQAAFESINGYYWYLRLRGYEVDKNEFQRRTIGQSYHLHKFTADKTELGKLLYKLCEKMGRRLRAHHLGALGIHVSFLYDDSTYWHHGHRTPNRLYATKELYEATYYVLTQQPEAKKVRILSVNCFSLFPWQPEQLSLLPEVQNNVVLAQALDKINDTYGEFTVIPATMMGMDNIILDRISFGQTDHTK